MSSARITGFLTVSSQAALAPASFQEREVCATENGFCGFQRLDLTSTGLSANLEVLQKPITFRMQGLDVLESCHQSLCCGTLFFRVGLQIRFQLGLPLLFVG